MAQDVIDVVGTATYCPNGRRESGNVGPLANVGALMIRTRPTTRTRQGQRRCFIHVGTHKTGTTSIQCFLSGNQERFNAARVFFPTAGREEDATIAHHQLAKELLGLPTFVPARGGLEAVARELECADADVACLSSEDFAFLYNAPRALSRLRDAIRDAGYAPRIIAYLRPQASYCSALYAENVRQGYRVSFERYFSDVLEFGTYTWSGGPGQPFDYSVFLDGFAAVFGSDAIIARTYRSGAGIKALPRSFAKLTLPSHYRADTFDIPKVRHNTSLDFGEVLRLLGVEHEMTERLRFAPLDIGKAARLGARFLSSNIALARRFRVTVPALEPLDIGLASPLRLTRSQTAAIVWARRTLARAGE
jgi:hypothetical protein